MTRGQKAFWLGALIAGMVGAASLRSATRPKLIFTWTPMGPWGCEIQGSADLAHWTNVAAVDTSKGMVTILKPGGPICFYRLEIPFRP